MTLAVWFCATPAQAQNVCDLNPASRDVGVTNGIPALALISPQHTAVNLAGRAVIDSYFVEIFAEGSTAPATSFTLPKTSWTLHPNTSDCYVSPAMPAVGGLLPTNFYRARVTARGPAGQSTTPLSVDRFFLEGVPVVSGLRIVAPE